MRVPRRERTGKEGWVFAMHPDLRGNAAASPLPPESPSVYTISASMRPEELVAACGCQEALWCFMPALASISGPTKVKVSPCLQKW